MSTSYGHVTPPLPPHLINLDSYPARVSLSVESKLSGLRAIKTISHFAKTLNLEARSLDTIIGTSTLKTALLLSLDDSTFYHLASPLLVEGSLQLIKNATGQHPGSMPLDQEYPQTCLKLLAISINAYLLKRWNILGEHMEPLKQPYRVVAHIKAAAILSKELKNRLNALADGDCTLLGRSADGSTGRAVLLPEECISDLMRLLWYNRKQFFQALASYKIFTVPEMSGLLFLFLKYVIHER
ncbi:hypothetical protein FRC11_002528, partial [Ceratobasidium sp. 423]